MNLSYLPLLPLELNQFVLFSLILVIGLIGGQLAKLTGWLPAISGYILSGFLLSAVNLLPQEIFTEGRIFIDISLGLILFDLGRRLDLSWLRNDPWLLPSSVLECGLSFVTIYFLLTAFGVPRLEAAIAATIGCATAPAVVLLVASELRADGPVTRRMFCFTALNNIAALCGLILLLPFVHRRYSVDLLSAAAHALYLLAGSFLLACCIYWITRMLAKIVGKNSALQFVLLVAMIIFAVGTARSLNLSVLLTLLSFGVLAKNWHRNHEFAAIEFGYLGQVFFIVLFVLTGAALSLIDISNAFLLGVLFVAVRFIGKSAGVLLLAWPMGISFKQATLLGIALSPMAGLALGMTQTIYDFYPEFGAKLSGIVVSAVALLQILGPIATRFSLRRAGEHSPDSLLVRSN